MLRRDFFKKVGATAAVVAVNPIISFAADEKPLSSNNLSYKDALNVIVGDKVPSVSPRVKLKVPEIAENGAVVPVTVEVESPMSETDYVKAIHILATKNFNPRSIDVHLTPANGKAIFSTRIKLASTQEVVTVVELSNDTFFIASQNVKVTIGGCG